MFSVEESAHAQVRLAKEAREQAVIALEKEPEDDLAQHLMGRWHSEMANINGVVRALIRLMYGTDLATGTHADALCHYRRAAELNPARLVHRCALVHFTPCAPKIMHPCPRQRHHTPMPSRVHEEGGIPYTSLACVEVP
jgi:hypothetical protein